jgi:hypothetical protein
VLAAALVWTGLIAASLYLLPAGSSQGVGRLAELAMMRLGIVAIAWAPVGLVLARQLRRLL